MLLISLLAWSSIYYIQKLSRIPSERMFVFFLVGGGLHNTFESCSLKRIRKTFQFSDRRIRTVKEMIRVNHQVCLC